MDSPVPERLQHNTAIILTWMLLLPEIKALTNFRLRIGTKSLLHHLQSMCVNQTSSVKYCLKKLHFL